MTTTLVLGGAGFLGSHLCDRLIAEGHTVYSVDNNSTGRESNFTHLIDHPNFHHTNQDITMRFNPYRTPPEFPPDYVVNMASPASPVDYARLPIETLRVGSTGTFNLLDLARKHDAVFLLASTSEVYGEPLISPQKEDYCGNVNPVGPRSVYDEAKRFSEALSAAYHRAYGMDTRIVRLFNTFGTRMKLNDGRAIPNFAAQAFRGEPLTIYGDGTQTRSFTYVDDTIDGIFRMMNLKAGSDLPLVNIGNPDEVPILQVADEIIELTNSKSEVVFNPLQEDDPTRRKPDITKAWDTIRWKPRISRKEGLKRTLPYFEEMVRLG